jgi:hypothetical protein
LRRNGRIYRGDESSKKRKTSKRRRRKKNWGSDRGDWIVWESALEIEIETVKIDEHSVVSVICENR